VLLVNGAQNTWRPAADAILRRYGISLDVYHIGRGGDFETTDEKWEKIYALQPDGAVLVRPDGHVGARFPAPNDATQTLSSALGTILGVH
jgi:hypothetical protein